ncbi:hypothetical protein GOP47_0007739 [Adiantum capillus-veneris]|uniref:Uncharacterized protein n=1 Tax=Adiantum capillus-veneris TaxID=13818 RepID=A0A9D4V1V2_ADICA|nr:hypothetical protein GOP47_0007739 [Adiantum capillus-veneris]
MCRCSSAGFYHHKTKQWMIGVVKNLILVTRSPKMTRARGLEPPNYNIQDEWKDFEKSIRDDLQEVDLRLEEEGTARESAIKRATKPFMNVNLSLDEDSTTDGDSEDENALLDWRAKQFQGK